MKIYVSISTIMRILDRYMLVRKRQYKVAQPSFVPPENSLPVQIFDKIFEVVCHADNGNRLDNKFE